MAKQYPFSRVLLAIVCVSLVLLVLGKALGAVDLPDGGVLGISCSDESQLVDALNNRDVKSIKLTDDITMSSSQSLTIAGDKTIHMGSHYIALEPGVDLSVEGPLELIGDGSPAMLLLSGSTGNTLVLTDCAVQTSGTFIKSDGNVTVKNSTITLRGDGTAIHTDGSINFFLTALAGGDLVAAGDINAHASNITSTVTDGIFLTPTMHLTPLALEETYTFKVGEEIRLPDSLEFRCGWDGTDMAYSIRYDVTWDTLPVSPGQYTVSGKPLVHNTPDYALDCQNLQTQVVVYAEDKVTLTGAALVGGNLELYAQMPADMQGVARLLISTDQGKTWSECALDGQSSVTGPSFKIVLSSLAENLPYHFCIQVVAQGRVLESNVLTATIVGDNVTTDTYAARSTYYNAMRPPSPSDESERSSNTTVNPGRTTQDRDIPRTEPTDPTQATTITESDTPLTQQAPETEPLTQNPSPARSTAATRSTAPATTQSTDQTPDKPPIEGGMVYTAQQLADLIAANPLQVTFVQDGLRLSIPTAALATVSLAQNELFVLKLSRESDDGFTVLLYAGEREILDFGGEAFELTLPTPDNWSEISEMTCKGSNSVAVPMLLNEENGSILITLRATGAYQVELERAKAAQQEDALDDEPVQPASASYQVVPEPAFPEKAATTPDNAFAGAAAVAAAMGFVWSLIWRWRRRT